MMGAPKKLSKERVSHGNKYKYILEEGFKSSVKTQNSLNRRS